MLAETRKGNTRLWAHRRLPRILQLAINLDIAQNPRIWRTKSAHLRERLVSAVENCATICGKNKNRGQVTVVFKGARWLSGRNPCGHFGQRNHTNSLTDELFQGILPGR
jgi:hypothetical protein